MEPQSAEDHGRRVSQSPESFLLHRDGKTAKRLVMLSDGKAEYQDIPCPNEL